MTEKAAGFLPAQERRAGFRRLLPALALTLLALAAIAASGLFAPLTAEAAGPGTTSSVTLTRADGTVTASWDAVDGATKYHVTYTTDGGASWHAPVADHTNVPTNSLTFAVDNAKTYVVGVRAGNDQGWGGWRNSPASGPYKATTPPGTVASVEVSRADGTLTASWDAPSGAATYHVTHSSTGGASWELAALDHPASGGATDSITFYVDNAQTYIVGVRAKNGAGGSGWRNSSPAGPFTPPLEPGPDPTPTPSPTPDPPGPDPVAPSAPTGLTATAGDGSVTLAWDDPSNASITGYEYLSRIAPPAPGWGAWTSIAGSGASTVSHTVEGLTNGKEYRFKVRAVNASGESDAAPDAAPWFVSATPALQPPAQPTGLTATVGEGGTATITWTNPNDPSITGYQYQTREDGGAWGGNTEIEGSGASTTSTEISGLTAGATNHINLQALNDAGASSGRTVSVLVPARLAGPDSVTITARGTGTLSATWTAVDGAFTYYVQTSNSSDDYATFTIETSTTGTSVTLNNRDDSLNYTVLVHAFTENGYTTRTESHPAGTSTSPAIAPESVSLSRSGTTLTATWPAVGGAANYNVAYSTDNGGTWTSGATAQTTTTWTKSSIGASTSYTVRVQSKNTTGTSAWTESDANTPGPPAPASVTLGTRSGTTLNVSWSAVTGAASYNVQSSSDNGTTWSASTNLTGTTTALTVDATKDYFVRVQAVNSSGNSGWTTSALSRATPLPPAPANLTYTRAKGSITLTWDAATGAASYDVACSMSGGHYWDDCKKGVTDAQRSAGVTFTQVYHPGRGQTHNIDDGRNYTFAVRGRNASGAGEWARVTAWATRPDRIASVTAASRDADGIALSMTVPADKGGYTVTRIEVDCRTSSDGGTTWSGWFKCTDAETQANPAGGSTLTTDIDSTDNYSTTLAYQARARAHNALGYTWEWRESATIHTVPGAPTINNYASTILAWSEPSHTGSGPGPLKYSIYCRPNASAAWTQVANRNTVPVGQTSHVTSLLAHSVCTGSTSQVELSIFNGFESERVRWSPLTFAASSITATSATLTLSNHGLTNWYAKQTAPTTGSCSSAITTDNHSLTLTGGTLYTYRAYSDSTCTDANEIGAVAFATPLTVSNLSETDASTVLTVGGATSFAQEFTTGSAAGGYTLTSVTLNFIQVTTPANITVSLRARQSTGIPATTALATLSGTPAFGNVTFTCSGSGCALARDTQYFIYVGGTAFNDGIVNATSSNNETSNPSGNGWSIADVTRYSAGSWGEHPQSVSLKLRVTASPKPGLAESGVTTTTATLTLTGHAGDWWLKRTTPTGGTCAAGESDFSHALSNLTAGTSYAYTAYSDSGCTSSNAIASASFTTELSAPTGLTATRTYSATANSDSVALSWTAPSSSAGRTGYEAECSTDGGTTWSACGGTIASSATSHSITGLDKGNAYVIRLRATGSGDAASAWAQSSSLAALQAPGTPTGLGVNTSTWYASWTAPSNKGTGHTGVTKYGVECKRALNSSNAGEATTTSKYVGGNQHCRNYSGHGNYVRVRAFNVIWGAWSGWHRHQ